MSNIEQATHNHKRAGAVVVLESTAELARIRVLTSRDEFWVKLKDLAELVGGVVPESKPSKKESRANRVNASPTRARRVVPRNTNQLGALATRETSLH
jgi:hypothetical protein